MIDLAALDLRAYIVAALVLVAVYLAYSLLPLLRLGRQPREPVRREAERFGSAAAGVAKSAAGPAAPRLEPAFGAATARAPEPYGEPADAPPAMFARELVLSNLEIDVKRLRHEMEQLRAEMARMAEEMRQLQATRNISPLYREAMTLAQQGEPAAGIAAQCGISVGEAELVAALARSKREGGFDGREDGRLNEPGIELEGQHGNRNQ